jgi:hypothetical protein
MQTLYSTSLRSLTILGLAVLTSFGSQATDLNPVTSVAEQMASKRMSSQVIGSTSLPSATQPIETPSAFVQQFGAVASPLGDANNIVIVNDAKDFPAPFQGVIKLAANKMYVVSGFVNIGVSCINLNGAGLKGSDPGKDGIISTVNGAVLRSTNFDIYTESVAVICATADTKAYDFQDLTGTKFCNLFSGTSVLDAPNIQSLGAGQISGFNTVCIEKNFWRTKAGLKVTGNMSKFTFTLNYVTGISQGPGLEFLSNAVINDIIIQTSYFVYSGEVGIKVASGASIDQGRLSLNLFRGVTTVLSGFDSFTPGWEMMGNGVGVPDSKGAGYLYMNENTAPTGFKAVTLFTKIQGSTKVLKANKFSTSSSNKFIFNGKRQTTLNVYANISALASATDDANSYSISVMKNGTEIVLPNSTVSNIGRGQGFQINLQTQVDMIGGDFIELYIKSNTNTTPIVVSDLLFKVSE